jgi:putative Mg2+ transporter-C (MgtC) family protein
LSDLELIERLCLAAFLGGVLGFEREWRNKAAGLRTNVLIAIGASLFTVMSIDLSRSSGGDPTRIAAQIVTGIGFLGAGAIMRTGGGVQGLTTAATIWVNAAVGVAAGGGEYRVAMVATAVAVGALVILDPVERLIDRRRPQRPPDYDATGAGPSGQAVEAPGPAAADGPPRPTRP